MQLIPVLVVEDVDTALDFYSRAFRAETYKVIDQTTTLRIQNQAFAIREADESDPAGRADSVLLLIETAAPDSVAEVAISHGATAVSPVDDRESGIRAGRLRDPFGFQWIVSTPVPR
ncbi:VOC family protein [Flaviflexus equikiangi]|uniref:VOC domain-containing protein n=1 Tax=Flaviflexus equikiangi TaxID=2758573 RepID=A0ABS2TD13_9ACTO|nr:VOC family protein [Flaviflexus equikiangi]MBM9432202.1 hypothetical protein [Flaviflexus equikiangi]